MAGFAAQQAGDLLEAAQRYQQVLAQDPSHFDATHMLGVVEYHRGLFDDALRLLARATQLRPDVVAARGNLEIVERARLRERQLSRAVLPRLAPLVDRIDDIANALATASTVNLFIAQTLLSQDEPYLDSLLAAAGAGVRIWADAMAPGARAEGVIALAQDSHPTGGLLIHFGTERSPLPWVTAARPERTLLVVTRDEPGDLLDRMRELSGEGRRRVGLLCAGVTLAGRVPLPAEVIIARSTGQSSST
jgi:hypothetical protein